jgi:CHAT domain-containing protein
LMTYFYEDFAKTVRPNEALQKAKIHYLAKENSQLTNPKYWAGLVNLR